MKTFDEIEKQYHALQEHLSASVVDLRHLLLNIEELVNSADYPALTSDQRSSLQKARKDLMRRIQQQEKEGSAPVEPANAHSQAPVPQPSTAPESAPARPEPVREHSPAAESQMEMAEKLFYSGRYAEAVQIFDRILQLEPTWERARQHRTEAENYLRTGYIPVVALPADAASAYGKAQSAARVGRFADALALLESAQNALRELGIQRWQEGQDFAQKLQENIDAEKAFEEGLNLFRLGNIDDAIERLQAAAGATGMPKYSERAQGFRSVKESLRKIYESLNQAELEPQAVSQAKASLDALVVEHGENPAFDRLTERFRAITPRVVEPLKEQTRTLKNQAEHAVTLEEGLYLNKQARQSLTQIRNLEGMDESLDRLQNEIERQLRTYQKFDNDLQAANQAYENNPNWPAQAARLGADLIRRFPNDPGRLPAEGGWHAGWHRAGSDPGPGNPRRLGQGQVPAVPAGANAHPHRHGNRHHHAHPHANRHRHAHPYPAAHAYADPRPHAAGRLHPAGCVRPQWLLRKIHCHRQDPQRLQGTLPASRAAL